MNGFIWMNISKRIPETAFWNNLEEKKKVNNKIKKKNYLEGRFQFMLMIIEKSGG